MSVTLCVTCPTRPYHWHGHLDFSVRRGSSRALSGRADPSGYGEGRTYLGTATTNISGTWAITLTGVLWRIGPCRAPTSVQPRLNHHPSNVLFDARAVRHRSGGLIVSCAVVGRECCKVTHLCPVLEASYKNEKNSELERMIPGDTGYAELWPVLFF